MNDTAQFRIQLPLGLRDRFKTLCLRSNVTMTDRVVKLIERDVAGLSNVPAPTQPKIATLNDDRLIARVVDACDRLGETAKSLGGGLQKSFDGFETKLLRAIPKPPNSEQIASADQQRLNQMLAKVEALHDRIIGAVDQGHLLMAAKWEASCTLRQAMGFGTLLGVALSAFLLWATAGTSPARSVAVALIDADSDWKAAKIIAGKGSPLSVELMQETVALLREPDFAKSYSACIERAKTAKHNFRCTVSFTRLVEAR